MISRARVILREFLDIELRVQPNVDTAVVHGGGGGGGAVKFAMIRAAKGDSSRTCLYK